MVDKLLGLRMFGDAAGKMNRSVVDVAGAVLVVPQFTLSADVCRGYRPSFSRAEAPQAALALYERVCDGIRQRGVVVEQGRFGADMQVQLVNDGPVTFWVDSVRHGRPVATE
jgi:D-tyrosyl-tRNA(Tyr) deacylase